MKRVGHIYEQMSDWFNLVEAERISMKRKMSNYGVKQHLQHRIRNLVEIQQNMINQRMETSQYRHEFKLSGQNKMRDISKLHFHPSHIQHQSLTMAATKRIERGLIRHTYASRIGYGQLACAKQIRKNIRQYKGEKRWYAQGDVCKYYQNIPHALILECLKKRFKDEKFIEAFMEPFYKFSDTGKGIPLGIRPSQIVGNLVLGEFDHFMIEQVKATDYVRYLDDFIFTGATKGEVKWKMKRAEKYLNQMGFNIHVPKIHLISEGLDTMGFVFYGYKTDMWWRKSNKDKWLRSRASVTNKKRLRELDDAAWGMLKWSNTDGRNFWQKTTGRTIKKNKQMPVKFSHCKMRQTERCDSNGVPYLDGDRIPMSVIFDKPVEVLRWVKNITTAHGTGRYAIIISFMGAEYKIIINSFEVKQRLDTFEQNGVTRFRTVFFQRCKQHYAMKDDETEIIEINHRKVIEKDGEIVFADNNEKVVFV